MVHAAMRSMINCALNVYLKIARQNIACHAEHCVRRENDLN